MVVRLKAIKPATFHSDRMRLEMLNELRKVGTEIKADFAETCETWKHKPKFTVKPSLAGKVPSITVSTTDEIYRWVDEGTQGDYPIVAGYYTGKSDKRALAYQAIFRPKTRRGRRTALAGGYSGDWVVRKSVIHPGIEAREFSKDIAADWGGDAGEEGYFEERMQEALDRAARKSGHGA